MDSPRPRSDDEIQRTFERINETLSVANMISHNAKAEATARRVLDVQRRIHDRVRELKSGAAPTDWIEWLEDLGQHLYPGRRSPEGAAESEGAR